MASSLEQERAAIAAEEERLAKRRKALAEREQSERQKLLGKSILAKAEQARLEPLLKRMKELGIDEVEKRLAA